MTIQLPAVPGKYNIRQYLARLGVNEAKPVQNILLSVL